MFDAYIKEAFFLVLLCSLLPLCCAAVFGLLVSFAQALTQIQEPSIVYLAKFSALCLLLWLMGSWLAARVGVFFHEAVSSIAFLGRLS